MANSFTQGTSQKVLDHYFGATALAAPPVTLYVLASTTTITDVGGNITEPVGNNYSRVAVTNNSTNFPAASAADPSHKKNGTAITFAQASGSWGTITDVAFSDASSGGNIIAYGALVASKTIGANDTLSLPINAVDITLT